jgi:DNA-binding CsgD family transcriptional regulator
MDVLADIGKTGGSHVVDQQPGLGAMLALLLDEMAYATVIATPDAKVVHANHAGRHELARGRVLTSVKGALHTRAPEDMQILQDSLARAALGKRGLITLATSDGAYLSVAVLPLCTQAGAPARAALMFSRALVCESLMLGFFARIHSLTPTEESVLGILCQGHSAPEVAQQMQVAVSTVRSHIRSLCAKTRSAGVRELVNRVAVLPPVAPAFWHEPMH